MAATLRAGVATITAVTVAHAADDVHHDRELGLPGRLRRPDPASEGGVWAIGGVISANSTLACSFGDNFYANIRNADISAFILGRVPDAARR